MLVLKKYILPNLVHFRKISSTAGLRSDELVVHRDTPDNKEDTPFEFTEANMTRIKALIKNYPIGSERSALGAALDIVQRQIGWVPISAMHKVAEMLSMPRMRVYEYATFYTMIKRSYKGKYHVKVCSTTPCMIMGSDIILQAVEQACCCEVGHVSADGMFGVDLVQCQGACANAPMIVIDDDYYAVEQACCCEVGHVSADGMFGVDLVQCQGACANAPMIVIDDDYYEDVTVCDVQNIIHTIRCGGIPPAGPQSGRFCAEPRSGLTTLCSPPPEPGYGLQAALHSPTDTPTPTSPTPTSPTPKPAGTGPLSKGPCKTK